MRSTRRAALTTAGVATLSLAGCSRQGQRSTSSPTSTAGSTASATSTSSADPGSQPSQADPDLKALDRAHALSAVLLADLRVSRPAIDTGGRLARIHADHLEAIRTSAPDTTETPFPTPGRRLTAGRLRARELAAQKELARLARSAQSGAVARLLASMSAGIAAGLVPRGGVPR
ncbi:hypothetical protein ISU10_14335 [Nocardioides agariphilus]|uniref:DUF4439 domain-containing protein n=1 Tax=Nocardioides agariphilus TaxID=433664 RepID=A0A930YHR8_9ACTN|nr:hypothetical protein [Nocardioides agariphilus]MBF4768941.1 hypothetical protein [Nocardioides agariphilus]